MRVRIGSYTHGNGFSQVRLQRTKWSLVDMQWSSDVYVVDSADLERAAHRLRAMPTQIVDLAARMIYDGVQIASSGPYSNIALHAMYNPHGPYSTAHPHPPMHPGFINFQTGRFYRSWVQAFRWYKDSVRVSTFNTAPYANALALGTDLMIIRPLPQLVADKVSSPLQVSLNSRVVKALE